MARKLKDKLAGYLLLRKQLEGKRTREAVPFEKAERIGILYDSTNERHYLIIKKLVKEIRDQHKEVLALGYYDRRELPAARFAKLGLDFFTRKSVNWIRKPSHTVVNNFINTRFDILICLNIESCFPLKYISARTPARFKIGRWDRRNEPYCDMMVHADAGLSMGKFVEQVLHYLKLIKHDSLQQA